MEILLTLEASTDWTINDSNESPAGRDRVIPYGLGVIQKDQEEKDLDYDEFSNILSPLGTPLSGRSPLTSRTGLLSNDNLSIRHIRSLSSGCDIKRALGFYNHIGRLNAQNNDILSRTRRYKTYAIFVV
jgi:hypothetical protein